MRSRHVVFATLLTLGPLVLATAPARTGSEPSGTRSSTGPNTPRAAVQRFADAYEARSLEQLGALLSADYIFHPSEGDKAAPYLVGFDRARELESAENLFGGMAAEGMRTTVGTMEESADPEHPDSLSQYRVVIACGFAFDMQSADGQIYQSVPADQVFHLVRGDVAQRLEGQPGGADRWYVRRWMENIRDVERQLAATDGRCDDAGDEAAGEPLAGLLAIRSLEAPLCPTLDVVCDLPTAAPATLEVYDLQGRRLTKQQLNPSVAGAVRVQAGSGRRFAPGAYWLRLTQKGRPPARRLVIVAR